VVKAVKRIPVTVKMRLGFRYERAEAAHIARIAGLQRERHRSPRPHAR
jgi:tRNA-dihydrouridine synthase